MTASWFCLLVLLLFSAFLPNFEADHLSQKKGKDSGSSKMVSISREVRCDAGVSFLCTQCGGVHENSTWRCEYCTLLGKRTGLNHQEYSMYRCNYVRRRFPLVKPSTAATAEKLQNWPAIQVALVSVILLSFLLIIVLSIKCAFPKIFHASSQMPSTIASVHPENVVRAGFVAESEEAVVAALTMTDLAFLGRSRHMVRPFMIRHSLADEDSCPVAVHSPPSYGGLIADTPPPTYGQAMKMREQQLPGSVS